jgi:hypothetical protein
MAQPIGDGWRMVRLRSGYEAQLWRNGELRASAWRQQPFTVTEWEAFARLQRDAVEVTSPPAAQSLPLSFAAPAFSFSANDLSREQLMAAAGGIGAVACLSLAALFAGQGARLSEDGAAIAAETKRIQSAIPTPAGAALDLDRQKLAAYAEIETRTSPLSAAGAAISIAAYHEMNLLSLDATAENLTMTLPYSAVRSADLLISDLEQSGFFHDVRPKTDAANQRLVIEMKTKAGAPPLSAN